MREREGGGLIIHYLLQLACYFLALHNVECTRVVDCCCAKVLRREKLQFSTKVMYPLMTLWHRCHSYGYVTFTLLSPS